MKLINSKTFKEKLNYLNYELYNSHPVGELSKEEKDMVSWFIYHISQMIDNMPIEDAIPIEWIKKWDANKNKDFYDCCKLLIDDFNENDVKRIIYKDMPQYNTVQALVEDWELQKKL